MELFYLKPPKFKPILNQTYQKNNTWKKDLRWQKRYFSSANRRTICDLVICELSSIFIYSQQLMLFVF